MSRNGRIALLLAALVVAVAAAVAIGTGGDDDEASTPTATATAGTTTAARTAPAAVPTVRLRDGRPVGGVRDLEFDSGERARFVIASDTAQEIHVHGYDITRSVRAGGRTTIAFRATIEGAFEVESHDTGEPIATLKVSP